MLGTWVTKDKPGLVEKIKKHVRRTYKRSTQRQKQMARARLEGAGYRTKDWGRKAHTLAGSWAVEVLTAVLPDVFDTTLTGEKGGRNWYWSSPKRLRRSRGKTSLG